MIKALVATGLAISMIAGIGAVKAGPSNAKMVDGSVSSAPEGSKSLAMFERRCKAEGMSSLPRTHARPGRICVHVEIAR